MWCCPRETAIRRRYRKFLPSSQSPKRTRPGHRQTCDWPPCFVQKSGQSTNDFSITRIHPKDRPASFVIPQRNGGISSCRCSCLCFPHLSFCLSFRTAAEESAFAISRDIIHYVAVRVRSIQSQNNSKPRIRNSHILIRNALLL